ncbi:MAG: hypothetical protein RMI91_02225 [Gemmatales bacterium]|nr:hypothetical protein [Gemmatales bacterium]MDW7993444.1 hypothetical protein [Gemmatales bacterium]
MLLAAMAHTGPDITPAVQTGLGWFYAILAICNAGFAWYWQRHLRTRPAVSSEGNNVSALEGGQRRAAEWSARVWFGVAALAAVLAILYFLGLGPVLPLWIRNTVDTGLQRGLETLGILGGANFAMRLPFLVLYWAAVLALIVDAVMVAAGGQARQRADAVFGKVLLGWDALRRLTAWLLIVSGTSLILDGLGPVNYFFLSVAVFASFYLWRKVLTRINVGWSLLMISLFLGGLGMTDYDFRQIIIKPDNVPIVGMVYLVAFFSWFALRRAVINDERIAQGLPTLEKEEEEKVLVWPDLVYTELICMVLVTVVLIIWSVGLPAPLEQPAASAKTPNPSKAPWYFLGLQEMLVYYDPWLAGVVFPSLIIFGLMAIPYIDFNQKGNGYYTFAERPFAIVTFGFGFIVLWVTLIFLGTFLRGPNWNFFGPFETWTKSKLVPLNNVDLSEYFWVRMLNVVWPSPASGGVILMRELPGIVLVLLYFLVLPPLLAKTIFRSLFIRMGFARYFVMVNLLLVMAALPIKMILRWAFNLKYIIGIPEYFFNI